MMGEQDFISLRQGMQPVRIRIFNMSPGGSDFFLFFFVKVVVKGVLFPENAVFPDIVGGEPADGQAPAMAVMDGNPLIVKDFDTCFFYDGEILFR